MKYIVEKEWLQERLDDHTIRIADCRFVLGKPEEGKKAYLEDHLPGAVYFHLEEELSGPVQMHGGRHPLPNLQQLQAALEAAGISENTTVIAYDQGEGAFAARFWWLLSYLGHKNVYVLNGGYAAWKDAGYPLDRKIPEYGWADMSVNIQPDMMAAYEEVKLVVSETKSDTILIDSREEMRYLGIVEPIDKKAGHIPGAVNRNWMEGLENGSYKPVSGQEKRFAKWEKKQPLIVYCGSGVTAAPNFIALKEAGYENVKLYVGSFSDWISYDDNEIRTEKEE